MNDMFLSVNNLADGSVTLENIRVEFDGRRAMDVSSVKVYNDIDDDGVVDIPGDILLGEGGFSGTVADIDIDPDLPIVFGAPVRLLVTYDISTTARLGYEIAATFSDTTNFQVITPDQVNFRTIMHSGSSVIIDPLTANDLTVTMYDLAPPYAPKGTEDVPMQALILNVSGSGDGLIFIENIFVTHTGTNPLDISKVKVYEDLSDIGVFEPDQDVLVGQGAFVGTIAEINMSDFMALAGPPQTLLITYDISTDAFPGHYASCMIEDESAISVYVPDYVNSFTSLGSGNTIITENIWSRCGGFDYTVSKHDDFHEFNIDFEATPTFSDTVYGRVHEDIFTVSFPSYDNNDNNYSILMRCSMSIVNHLPIDISEYSGPVIQPVSGWILRRAPIRWIPHSLIMKLPFGISWTILCIMKMKRSDQQEHTANLMHLSISMSISGSIQAISTGSITV
jgi:hypothetical protein